MNNNPPALPSTNSVKSVATEWADFLYREYFKYKNLKDKDKSKTISPLDEQHDNAPTPN